MENTQDKINTMKEKRRNIMVSGAKRYAAANKSDPFAFGRCMAHINSGAASFHRDEIKGDVRPGYYDAKEASETREITRQDGSTLRWNATVYRDVVCP